MEDILESIVSGGDPEEAVERALGLPEKEQGALIEAAGRTGSENAARFLALLYPSLSDKSLRKLLKKALFLLKTQGVRVEEPKPEGEPALRKIETSREAWAFLSNFDDELARVLLVAFEARKNNLVLGYAVLHFSKGLLTIRSGPVTKDEFDDIVADQRAGVEPPMFLEAISAPYAGYLLESVSGGGLDDDAREARGIGRALASAKGDVRFPEEILLLDAGSTPPASGDAVFSDPMFETFSPKWRGIEEDIKRLDEAASPGIVLPPYMVEERKRTLLDELAADPRLAASAVAFHWALFDYAYLFYCRKEYGLYRGLVEVLGDEASVKRAFVRFMEKGLYRARKKEEDHKLPGLIVSPHELKK